MRLATSQYTDTITLHHGDAHLVIAPKQEIDLDAELAPGVTIAAALGDRAEKFAAVEPNVEHADLASAHESTARRAPRGAASPSKSATAPDAAKE